MDLDQLRKQIDTIDDELLNLFLRRMHLVEQVAEYKIKNNLPVFHAGREDCILKRMEQKAGPQMAPYVIDFYGALMATSRSFQETKIKQTK